MILRFICRIFNHAPVLVAIKSGPVTITSRGRRTTPPQYIYECRCCGDTLVDPFKGEAS